MHSSLLGYLQSADCNNKDYGWYDIIEGADILIGRDPQSCQLVLDDPTISNKHVRIYSVIYDETTEPFVYAENLSRNGCYWLQKKGFRYEKHSIGKGSAFLLSDGDKITMCDWNTFIFRVVPFLQSGPQPEDLLDLKRLEIESFDNRFNVTNRRLGTGGSGCVLMAVDRWKSRQVACKIVNLEEIRKNPRRDSMVSKLWREVELLKRISHVNILDRLRNDADSHQPNIVRVEQVFRSRNTIYIIEELLTGGDLASYIDRNTGQLDDTNACSIVYQTLEALQHLHRQGIVHRDLKPENILLSSTSAGARVILTDFGQAIKVTGDRRYHPKRMETLCGTIEWVAPEVRGKNKLVSQAGYTKSIDMWSLGCLTAALLIGTSIFVDPQDSAYRQNSTAAITTAAAKCDLTKLDTEPLWKHVSKQAKDFVKQVVRLEENERLSAEQALKHPWFSEGDRKAFFQTNYKKAIESWKPHRPGLDFIEDLDALIQGRRLSADFCAMGKRRRSASVDREEAVTHAEAGSEKARVCLRESFWRNCG